MDYLALALIALLSKPSPAMIPPRKAGPANGEFSATEPAIALPQGVGIKRGVVLRGLDRRMHTAIREARGIWLKHGRPLVITSGLDGRHGKGSRHYAGLALDFRSRDLGQAASRRAAQALRKVLGREFLVLVEKDHIHVEHNPSSGPAKSKLARASRPSPKGRGRATAELAEGIP